MPPPRVTYWTGLWDPAREALSKEVESLRQRSPTPPLVVSFSSGQRSAWPRGRIIRLSGKRWLSLRAVAAVLEARGDVTHVFGAVDAWALLRCLGRRPLLFTVALPGRPLDRALYEKVRIFAVESEALASALLAAGVPQARVRLVYPGVDLGRFSPAPLPPACPFRIVFASTPGHPGELERRGVPLLIEVARQRPDIEIIMPWRRWGDQRAMTRALELLNPPPNLKIEPREVQDMAALYNSAHATACWFAEGFGKSCPNSIVEGLACGRPALVSDSCGIAQLIQRRSAGVAAPRTPQAMIRAIDLLREEIVERSRNARTLAEECFDVERFRAEYGRLYETLANPSSYQPNCHPRAAHVSTADV